MTINMYQMLRMNTLCIHNLQLCIHNYYAIMNCIIRLFFLEWGRI